MSRVHAITQDSRKLTLDLMTYDRLILGSDPNSNGKLQQIATLHMAAYAYIFRIVIVLFISLVLNSATRPSAPRTKRDSPGFDELINWRTSRLVTNYGRSDRNSLWNKADEIVSDKFWLDAELLSSVLYRILIADFLLTWSAWIFHWDNISNYDIYFWLENWFLESSQLVLDD